MILLAAAVITSEHSELTRPVTEVRPGRAQWSITETRAHSGSAFDLCLLAVYQQIQQYYNSIITH